MAKISAPVDYRTAFVALLTGGLATIRRRISAASSLPDEQTRTQTCHLLDYGLELPDLWDETAQLLLALAPWMEQAGLRAEWLPFLQRGLRMATTRQDTDTAAELHLQIGWLYSHLGRLDEAHAELTTAVALQRRGRDAHGLGQALNRLALVERRRQATAAAVACAHEALACLPADDPERANCYVVLGEVAMDARNWADAANHARTARAIWAAAGDRRRVAWALRNLGPILCEQGQLEEAEQVLREAHAILLEVQDPAQAAVANMNLATVMRLQARLDEAVALYDISERTLRQVGDEVALAMVYVNRGATHRQLGHWARAEEDLQTSVILWQRVGNLRSQVNALDELGILYRDQGDRSRARSIFTAALALLPDEDEASAAAYATGYAHLRQLLTTHLEATARARGAPGA